MKQLTIVSLLMLSAPVWASTSAPVDLWHADFSNGRLPSGVAVQALGEARPIKERYKNGYTEDGWKVGVVGNKYCAISPTSTGVDVQSENIFTLPTVAIPDDAQGTILRWTARSILPGMPEAYEVEVRAVGSNEWTLLCGVDEEESVMTMHVVSLGSYAGQEIELRFSCVSVNRYMLGIGEIYVGVPSEPLLEIKEGTPRFAENFLPRNVAFSVCGSLLNCGAEVEAGSELRVRSAGEDKGTFKVVENVASGETIDFDIPFDAPDNATTPYDLVLVRTDGSEQMVLQSDVTRAGFARTLFVDEGTGIWCNNCPQGNLDIAKLERQYPGQVVAVSTHVNDILANEGYWNNLGFYAVPYFMLNRNRATAASGVGRFEDFVNEGTIASIRVAEGPDGDRGHVAATLEVMFDHELDEPARYGVGYVLTSPFYHPTPDPRWMQQNRLTTGASEQYYFLPSVIPSELSFYENVSIGDTHSFEALDIDWGNGQTAYCPGYVNLDLGNLFDGYDQTDESSPREISLVAYVLDKTDGKILNATRYPLQHAFDQAAGIKEISDLRQSHMRVVDGHLLVSLPEKGCRYSIVVSDITGKTLSSYEGEGSGDTISRLPDRKGVVIVTLLTPDGKESMKVVI